MADALCTAGKMRAWSARRALRRWLTCVRKLLNHVHSQCWPFCRHGCGWRWVMMLTFRCASLTFCRCSLGNRYQSGIDTCLDLQRSMSSLLGDLCAPKSRPNVTVAACRDLTATRRTTKMFHSAEIAAVVYLRKHRAHIERHVFES